MCRRQPKWFCKTLVVHSNGAFPPQNSNKCVVPGVLNGDFPSRLWCYPPVSRIPPLLQGNFGCPHPYFRSLPCTLPVARPLQLKQSGGYVNAEVIQKLKSDIRILAAAAIEALDGGFVRADMVLKRAEECELGETGDDNDETKALKAKYKVLNWFSRRVQKVCGFSV